jgi:hypothetical protein
MVTSLGGDVTRNGARAASAAAKSLTLGPTATFPSQSQLLVEDGNYMRGMIPHHSIAILTSERAGITDVRVRELADKIIEGQRRENAEMEWLLAGIAENCEATTEKEAEARPVPSFEASPQRRLTVSDYARGLDDSVPVRDAVKGHAVAARAGIHGQSGPD